MAGLLPPHQMATYLSVHIMIIREFTENDIDEITVLMKSLCAIKNQEFEEERWRASLEKQMKRDSNSEVMVALDKKTNNVLGMANCSVCGRTFDLSIPEVKKRIYEGVIKAQMESYQMEREEFGMKITTLTEVQTDVDMGTAVTYFPSIHGGKPVSFIAGHYLAMRSQVKGKQAEAVWEYIKFVCSEDAMRIRVKTLVDNGVICVSEGANMPTEPDAVEIFINNGVLYGPGKAANAGGVATSGLEMSQNSLRLSWTREEVNSKLHQIMINIHQSAFEAAEEVGTPGNYVNGANIAGFKKVADAMIAEGI